MKAIIRIALIACLAQFGSAAALALTGAAEDTRLKMLGTLAAENRLLELRLLRQRLELGQATGDCEEGGVQFVCEQTIRGTPNPFFRRVEVRVSRGTDAGRRVYAELMTVLPTQ